MKAANEALDKAIAELDRLRSFLKRNESPQIRSSEEKAVIKANSLAWFNNHRGPLTEVLGDPAVNDVDAAYKVLLSTCDKASARSRCDAVIKATRAKLLALRGPVAGSGAAPAKSTTDSAPSFSALIPDVKMQGVLALRWHECAVCVTAGAPLAAVVMMGGLVEALLLARIHREPNKGGIFGANGAPQDKLSGKTLPLQDWTLRHYIDVAHELGWISRSAKDVSDVLRDYRNYIHPFKQVSHGITIGESDARLLWEVAKGIARQLL